MIRYKSILLALLFIPAVVTFGSKESRIEKKVRRVHEHVITIDSHTDTPLRLSSKGFDIRQRHDPVKDHSKIDFPRMKEGGLDAAFFAVFVSQGKRTPAANEKAEDRAIALFDTIHKVVARCSDIAGLAMTSADARALKKQGKTAVFIGMENGYPIGKDIDLVNVYHELGARYITLCHTKNNDLCDSSTDTTEHNGLSEFGKNVVLYMNRLGMMVDVSHISDKSFYDVLAITHSPVIASHSCARAICNNPRNMDDKMLKAIARNGGVIQMCILSDYVKTPAPNPKRDSAGKAFQRKYPAFENLSEEEMKKCREEWNVIDEKYPEKLATVSDVADHIDHIVKVAGIRHVGIGTDFDGGGGVEGCFDVSQMDNITRELLSRGYTVSQLRKIWGGNLMRVMDKNVRIAKKLNKICACGGK
ncbi:MAG: dipeptidase [Bacteroidota bacterium]|nr:dipeptidase [Bacteroidota bacterium]